MDTATVQDHLRLAEQHVAEGERTVARQTEVVAAIEDRGADARLARSLVALFQDAQAAHIADRDRLLAELAQEPGQHALHR